MGKEMEWDAMFSIEGIPSSQYSEMFAYMTAFVKMSLKIYFEKDQKYSWSKQKSGVEGLFGFCLPEDRCTPCIQTKK